jgi:hypothetical protein
MTPTPGKTALPPKEFHRKQAKPKLALQLQKPYR